MQPPQVADIIKRLPPEIMTVGVFRDEAPQRIAEIVNQTGLLAAQLHGHESPAITKLVAERVRYVIKAFAAADPALDRAADFGAYAVLMDAPRPGSGQLFDWSLTGRVADGTRLLLAGGLTADNVTDAIAATHPWGVDVSSGVEAALGRKDPVKVRAFVAAAKAAPVEVDVEEPSWMTEESEANRPFDWRTDS
jgi:phosphoribosylanthranilate isomerase